MLCRFDLVVQVVAVDVDKRVKMYVMMSQVGLL